eukprot:scaffold211352_cov15-Tisochrysis_lutea.AAC.1
MEPLLFCTPGLLMPSHQAYCALSFALHPRTADALAPSLLGFAAAALCRLAAGCRFRLIAGSHLRCGMS